MPELAPGAWALLVLGALLVGMSKTGVPGLGILVVTIAAHALGGNVQASAGIVLPLLCVADLVGVVIYRRHAEARALWSLVPWVLAGMALGAAALAVDTAVLRRVVAAVILLMVALQLLRARLPAPGARAAAGYGIAAGFATTVANAAGPVMNLYLLARRMPKEAVLATGAWFFLVINLAKLPVYACQPLWGGPAMITPASLLIDLCLVPAVLAGAGIGRLIAARIPQAWFERSVLALAALGAIVLAW
ncbi:MAG: hypothetical protein RLZZ127_2681 [Planctomycetota bacterium]|jgi:uncharacterized membrane protein YfcA